jgi:hypothetical protein
VDIGALVDLTSDARLGGEHIIHIQTVYPDDTCDMRTWSATRAQVEQVAALLGPPHMNSLSSDLDEVARAVAPHTVMIFGEDQP